MNFPCSWIYQFYQRITKALSDLKDSHIKISFQDTDFEDFLIVGPFDYYIKSDEEGNYKIYATCQDEPILQEFEQSNEIMEFCSYYSDEFRAWKVGQRCFN